MRSLVPFRPLSCRSAGVRFAKRISCWFASLMALSCFPLAGTAKEANPLCFHLTFDRKVSKRPFTGRVYVLLSRKRIQGLIKGVNWFKPEPFFALDVTHWKPGEVLVFDNTTLGYPVKLTRIPRGTYHVQAVMDLDQGGRRFTRSPGNGYSVARQVKLDPANTGTIKLTLDQVYQPTPFRETERVKLVDIPSTLLTKFHGKPMRLRAGVVLPTSYKDSDKRFPVVYEVPGFGGTHHHAHGRLQHTRVAGVDMIWVVLDPSCRLGHHVFADSANNGPYGQALVKELIPAIEKRFRILGKPSARFVTGHSSGGWSSLWLQITHPDFFGGVWATSPDPVDFRDFQRIDLTRPGANLFYDTRGNKRPIARRGNKPVLWFKGFSDMEVVIGRGGQLASFEAVFSPRGKDGKPMRMWDRTTGKVNLEVARAWEPFDIRKVLETNWKTLGPRLKGKLHIYTGGKDTFYLEGAVKLLKQSLKKLGSNAVVEIFPDRNHGNLLRKIRPRIAREMAAQLGRSDTLPAGGGQ